MSTWRLDRKVADNIARLDVCPLKRTKELGDA